MGPGPRVVWQQEHVVDVRDAAFAARTWIEQRDLRIVLAGVLEGRVVDRAAEVGSGFGRMTPVLTEFAASVSGFEREGAFVAEASVLHPAISFAQVDTLARLPAADASLDLVLTFTVLQHLVDAVLAEVAAEIRRVLRPSGVLVLCEETDVSHRSGDVDDPNGMCTIGRSVPTYAELFRPLALVATRPRRVEPTYPRPDVGTYIVFAGPARSG